MMNHWYDFIPASQPFKHLIKFAFIVSVHLKLVFRGLFNVQFFYLAKLRNLLLILLFAFYQLT